MERLIEYVTPPPSDGGRRGAGAGSRGHLRVAAIRATSVGAISSQDLIRLMNQGALVLDIRKPEEFAAGPRQRREAVCRRTRS